MPSCQFVDFFRESWDTMLFIPDSHVRLILLMREDNEGGEGEEEDGGVFFSLIIPLDTIDSLCLTPRKYLLYLGWCILGFDADDTLALGLASEDGEFHSIDDNGDLEGGGTYNLTFDGPPPDMAVVDVEVIKARTHVPSETTGTRDGFRDKLIQRDIYCAFTGIGADGADGLHIIPFKRGPEWFRLIVQNRPHEDDDYVGGLEDINDVRNGIFTMSTFHRSFDARKLVILKTPNSILGVGDIPPNPDRLLEMPLDDVGYPEGSRYSAQWLDPSGRVQSFLPNNTDAAFGKASVARKPSALLLHYNYGAAAVKLWGHNTHILESHAKKSRPPKPAPPKQVHDRTLTIEKRRIAAEEAAKKTRAGEGRKRKATMDEDDVMLFFWGNSRRARERYLKTREEKRENLEQWRQGLPLAF